MWAVAYSSAALRDLKKLPADTAASLVTAVDLYAATGQGDVKRMKGVHPPAWRLRVGDWRAIFEKDKATITISVIRAGHRKDVYLR